MSDLVDQLLQATSDPVAWKVATVRIEALKAAGNRLADALAHLIEFTDMTGQGCAAQQVAARSALAAWREAEKGDGDE